MFKCIVRSSKAFKSAQKCSKSVQKCTQVFKSIVKCTKCTPAYLTLNALEADLRAGQLSLEGRSGQMSTNAERERYESLATLYGIIVALDYLERAYVRDSVTAAE